MKVHKDASTRAINRASTLEEDFKTIHNNKFTYSKFVYLKSIAKSTITCPVHGDFQQSANDHLNGYGCPKCGKDATATSRRKSADNFITSAILLHGDIIDYSKVVYKNDKTSVEMRCKVHGTFKQRPGVHLVAKFACPKCGKAKSGLDKRNTTDSFISKAVNTHGERYDYTATICETTSDKVSIACHIHGIFSQLQSNHLAGNGCPKCGLSGFKENKPAILYYVSINNGEAYKIGITNRTIKQRFGVDYSKVTILGYATFLSGEDARLRETQILQKFSKYKYTGTPLLATGNSELFNKDILNLSRKSNE